MGRGKRRRSDERWWLFTSETGSKAGQRGGATRARADLPQLATSGGKARWNGTSAQARRQHMRMMALARWGKRATLSEDRPPQSRRRRRTAAAPPAR